MAQPPFRPESLPPGTRLAGKYELGPAIGWGEHSVVYVALHRLLQRKAAVKVLAATDPAAERRFQREAQLVGSLSHPNIVELYEVGRLDDGRAFLAMEYLEGETVEQRLGKRGPFGIAEATKLGRDVLAGLALAHEQQIVHRDICPDNLFFCATRTDESLKILDFGISRRFGNVGDSTLTAPGTVLGKVGYLAPEQLFDDGEIDHRTDLYAVGVLLYHVLAGRLPFASKGSAVLLDIVDRLPDPPSRYRAGLTNDIDRVLAKALAKKAADRFQSADEMSEALRLASLFADYERR